MAGTQVDAGPVRTGRGALSVAGALTLVALLVFGFVGYLLVVSPLQQQRTQNNLFDQIRGDLAQATAPIGGAIAPGTPVAVLTAPSIGLETVVVEGTSAADLLAGPGHRRDTPLPGQAGVSLLYGRAGTFGAPFRRVPDLVPGATVNLVTGQGEVTYRVEGVRRDGDPLPAPLPAGGGRLTLVTTDATRMLTAADTVFVDAVLVGEPWPAPAGRPRLVAAYERALQPDPTAAFPLVLWLQALALAAGGLTWARHRWGRVEAWVVGTPIVLACGWQVYEAAVRLLPNLL
ncbi:sortase [Polymorphospora sp. NPDC050346]|uniref:sortase n=1 Tax=Polymorphospora sp. NPDC050346 TaxID=3155780 RepID=UPI0033F1C0AB